MWQLALIQHPMYLLIREDTLCAERTPPWGEPTIERYIERIRTILRRLNEYPALKVGFEWSGLELELLAKDAPDVLETMRELAAAGRVAFYNGTYAQPHAQIQSAEANIRQLEWGARVYQDLLQMRVVTYAHQETSVHDQMPQLLAAFGFQYSVLPHFPSVLHWLDDGAIVMRLGEPQFLRSREFVQWVGLDGTEIPLYLAPHRHPVPEWITRETMAGGMRGPDILVENRDLVELNREWLAARAGATMVLLDEAFAAQLAHTPARGHARHYTYWSYIEGIRAEELSRANWIAERQALHAEALAALAFVLLGQTSARSTAFWDTILAAQHHDAYCFGAPELRAKMVARLYAAIAQAREQNAATAAFIAEHIDTNIGEGVPLVVFQLTPHRELMLVSATVPAGLGRVVDAQGQAVPARVLPERDGSARLEFLTPGQGLGYQTFLLKAGETGAQLRETDESISFENAFYSARVNADGVFSSLCLVPAGVELLAQGRAQGGLLRATDSTGISPRENPGLVNKPLWELPVPPVERLWRREGPLLLQTDALGLTARVTATLGASIRVALTVEFFHALPRIELRYQFDFDDASVGIFYLDETKLRLSWALNFGGDIHHDIPFGVVQSGRGTPILATSWVDLSDGNAGFAYLHRGTYKHWVQDNTLSNLFAWGEETNAIGDRIWRENWAKSFDQRLRGRQVIECAVYPHTGDWRAANVVGMARSYSGMTANSPTTRHAGILESQNTLLAIRNPELATTSVGVRDGMLACRVYSFAEHPIALDSAPNDACALLYSLTGEAIAEIKPFQIGWVSLAPPRRFAPLQTLVRPG